MGRSCPPIRIGANGPASRNPGVSRRFQPNAWMEVHDCGADLDLFIPRQARTYRHRTFGRDWRAGEDQLCRVSSGDYAGSRKADQEARLSARPSPCVKSRKGSRPPWISIDPSSWPARLSENAKRACQSRLGAHPASRMPHVRLAVLGESISAELCWTLRRSSVPYVIVSLDLEDRARVGRSASEPVSALHSRHGRVV